MRVVVPEVSATAVRFCSNLETARMRVVKLLIEEFSPIRKGTSSIQELNRRCKIWSGKGAIVDARSLAFGKCRVLRNLTEYDSMRSCLSPADPTADSYDHHGFLIPAARRSPLWFRMDVLLPIDSTGAPS